MSHPARWLWGLVPLSLLWGAGNLLLDEAMEQDVARRAEAAVHASAGATPGARPVMAQVEGRDVTIGGEVLSADGAAKAMSRLRSEFGVRRALGGLSQVVAQKPYSWFASRQAGSVTLGGFVPDIASGEANVSAAREALPSARIDDRQVVAFGAPEGFAAMTRSLIAGLPHLAEGRIAIDDGRFCIEGRAATPEAFMALEQASGQPASPGFTAVACGLQPPVIDPYLWSLERSGPGTLTMRGFHPDEASRKRMLAAITASFPPPTVIGDETKPAAGAPAAFVETVGRAARDLARLRSGKAEIEGSAYRLSGQGPENYAACAAMRLQIAQEDGPDSVAEAVIVCPPAPPPDPVIPPLPEVPSLILEDVLPGTSAPSPSRESAAQARPAAAPQPAPPQPVLPWSATREGGRLVLEGSIRDEAARQAIIAEARRLFPGLTVADAMGVVAAAAPELPQSTAFALKALSNLAEGSAVIRGGALSLSGHAVDAPRWQALRDALAETPPPGLALASRPESLPVRPYELALSSDRSGVRISGLVPDEATRRLLRDLLADTPLAGKLDDDTAVVPGAPPGFAEAARTVLSDLLRLDIGSAVITDDRVTLRGITCRELIASEVETSAATGLPAGFVAQVAVSPRQTGCVLDPPASCQNDLDGLTKQNPVLFAQGTAAVTLDPTTERVMAAAAEILRKCPGAKVTIEGHANRDGAWRGFDNRELSLRRAQRVREELARRGIDAAGLDVKGYGTTRPLLPHGAPQSREMNRRVQFTIAK